MAETTSGTTSFNLPVDEIMEMAFESLGGEFVTHKEARMARTALNLLLIDLQTRQVAPFASLKETVVPLVAGQDTYTMLPGVFNIMDVVIRQIDTNGHATDLPISKMTYTEWLDRPNKTQKGRPSRVLVNKQREGIELRFDFVPDSVYTYQLRTWAVNKIQDVSKSYQILDLPTSYLPAITMGLTYFMSIQRGLPIQERDWYLNQYELMLDRALGDDRERTDIHLYPAYYSPLWR